MGFGKQPDDGIPPGNKNDVPIVIEVGAGFMEIEFDGEVYNLEEGLTGTQNGNTLNGKPISGGTENEEGRAIAADVDIDIDDLIDYIGIVEVGGIDGLDNTTAAKLYFSYDKDDNKYIGKISFLHIDTDSGVYIIVDEEDEIDVEITEFGEVGGNIKGTFIGTVTGIKDTWNPGDSGATNDKTYKNESIKGEFEIKRVDGIMDLDYVEIFGRTF